jgi:cytochrome P460
VRGFSVFVVMLGLLGAGGAHAADGPQFTADGKLVKPDNYREWIFLSSGSGMTYGPAAEAARDGNPPFDNVFVNPSAYRSFLSTGTWPDQTIFVLEVRASQSKGSINKGGRFQAGVVAVEAEVKDEKRFPGKWGFFAFEGSAAESRMIPGTAVCYSCHKQNGAVDNTFVQFYPTLIEIAKQKGTFKRTAE